MSATIYIEKKIVRRLVKDILNAGMGVRIDNGGEPSEMLHPADNEDAIMAELFATDEEQLYLHTIDQDEHREPQGWIKLVHGNDGTDVIGDYTTNLEQLVSGATKLAEQIERGEEC